MKNLAIFILLGSLFQGCLYPAAPHVPTGEITTKDIEEQSIRELASAVDLFEDGAGQQVTNLLISELLASQDTDVSKAEYVEVVLEEIKSLAVSLLTELVEDDPYCAKDLCSEVIDYLSAYHYYFDAVYIKGLNLDAKSVLDAKRILKFKLQE